MKKIFWIALVLCLTIPLIVYAIDGSDFDADNDGDVDAEDLAGFAQYFGTLRYYRDFDGDYYSNGTSLYSKSQPTNYYLESELISTNGDCDDEDSTINQGAEEICDGMDNDCDGETDEDCITEVSLVISEIDYDQAGTDNMEFVEIYNWGTSPVNLSGFSVILVNGAYSSIYNTIDLSVAGNLPPGEHLVIKSPNLLISSSVLTIDFPALENNIQNGPDAIQLVKDLGGPGEIAVDSVAYEGDVYPYTETLPVIPGDIGTGSIGRIGGSDTDNNSVDFVIIDPPSPGLSNL